MTPAAETKRSVSPIKKQPPLTIKPAVRSTLHHKENNPNASNLKVNAKNPARKLVSPLRVSQAPTIKKVELRPSKSPIKEKSSFSKLNSKTPKAHDLPRIQKLFRYLTKGNPANVKILTPEYINIKGLDRHLLNDLQ